MAKTTVTPEQFFPDQRMDSSTDSTSHKNTATFTSSGGQQQWRSNNNNVTPFWPDTVQVVQAQASGQQARLLTNVGRETFRSGGTDIPLVASSSDRFVPQPAKPTSYYLQQLQPTASAHNMPYDTTTFHHKQSIQITPTKD